MSPDIKIQVRLNPENPQDKCISKHLEQVKLEANVKGLRYNESQTVRDLIIAGIEALAGSAVAAPASPAAAADVSKEDLVRLIRQTLHDSESSAAVDPQQIKAIVAKSVQDMMPEIQKAIVAQMFSGMQPAAAQAAEPDENVSAEKAEELAAELAESLINSQF